MSERPGYNPSKEFKREMYSPQPKEARFAYEEFAPDNTPAGDHQAAVERGNRELTRSINAQRQRRETIDTMDVRQLARAKADTNDYGKDAYIHLKSMVDMAKRKSGRAELPKDFGEPIPLGEAPESSEVIEVLAESKERIEKAQIGWLRSFVESARGVSEAAGKVAKTALLEAGSNVKLAILKDLQEAKRMLTENRFGQYLAEDLKTLRHMAIGEKGSGEYLRVDTDPDERAPIEFEDWFNNVPGDWVEDRGRPNIIGESVHAMRDLAEGAKYVLTGGFTKEILKGLTDATRSKQRTNKEVLDDLLDAARNNKRERARLRAEADERAAKNKEILDNLLSAAKRKEAEKLAKELPAQGEGFQKRIELSQDPDENVSDEEHLAAWQQEKNLQKNERPRQELVRSIPGSSRDVVSVFRYVQAEIQEIGDALENEKSSSPEAPAALDLAAERVQQAQRELTENAMMSEEVTKHFSYELIMAEEAYQMAVQKKRHDIALLVEKNKKSGDEQEKKRVSAEIIKRRKDLARFYSAYHAGKKIQAMEEAAAKQSQNTSRTSRNRSAA